MSSKIASVIYDKLFRKTSTFVVAIGVTAIFADRAVDGIAETIWEKVNEGRLWKDVKRNLNLDAPKGS